MAEWIRFGLTLCFLVAGLSIFLIELFGVFRFRFVLNRMQAAATGDTLGISLCLVGLMIANGFNFTSAKLVLVVVFLWFASPVSSHMISRLEYITDEDLEKYCDVVELEELHREQAAAKEQEVTVNGGSKDVLVVSSVKTFDAAANKMPEPERVGGQRDKKQHESKQRGSKKVESKQKKPVSGKKGDAKQ